MDDATEELTPERIARATALQDVGGKIIDLLEKAHQDMETGGSTRGDALIFIADVLGYVTTGNAANLALWEGDESYFDSVLGVTASARDRYEQLWRQHLAKQIAVHGPMRDDGGPQSNPQQENSDG